MTHERTPVGKEFHARGPATQKALSLRRRLVRGRLKSPGKASSNELSSTSRQWSQTTTTFCLINVSGRSTYSSVHCRWQSVSCYSRSSVEQSSITRHCCPPLSPSSAVVLNHISSHFRIPLSDSSLIILYSQVKSSQVIFYNSAAQWLVILDTIIFITFYLFIYSVRYIFIPRCSLELYRSK